MAVRFSAVTVTSQNEQSEFLVSGIPKSRCELDGWTAFDSLINKLDAEEDIQVHVAACLYGDGEVFDATPEEVAYFTLRAKADEHFFYNHCKDIGKSDFTIHFIPKNTNFKEKSTMNEWERNRRMAERMRESYPEGTRLTLLSTTETMHPVPEGMRGTVAHIDDQAQIHMHWDNGRTLAIVPGEDSFRKLTDEELREEQNQQNTENNDETMNEDNGPVMGM